MNLKNLRADMDRMNPEITSVVAKRIVIARQIARYKQKNGLQIKNTDRENRVIADMEREFVLHGMRSETGRMIAKALIEAAINEERAITKTV